MKAAFDGDLINLLAFAEGIYQASNSQMGVREAILNGGSLGGQRSHFNDPRNPCQHFFVSVTVPCSDELAKMK